MAGEHLDLSSEPPLSAEPSPLAGAGQGRRPFVGMHFTCCDIYTRIYLSTDRASYLGHCPRCGRRVQLHVGPGGSDARFFTAT